MNASSSSRRLRDPSPAEASTQSPLAEVGPAQSKGRGGDPPQGTTSERATNRSNRAPRVLLGLLAVATVAGSVTWVLHRGKESTDDAQIEGHVVPLSFRTPGQVAKVRVSDNQLVQQGDVLVELDLDELKSRLNVAKADRMAAEASLELARAQLALTERTANAGIRQARGGVSQATSGVASSKAQVDQARADLDTAESRHQLAIKELDRVRQLHAEGSVSQAELDIRQAAADQSTAGVELARARLNSSQALIVSNYGGVEQAQGRLVAALTAPQQLQAAEAQVQLAAARVEQSRAAERLAELNLSYGTVRAPVTGVVSRKNVEVGSLVSPERPVMALVPLDDVWVVANFKEDQLAAMKPGQPVTIDVDTFSGRSLSGKVESLAAGTGARFALLPPDNAAGNFVKVVQRVPVRITIDDRVGLALRPGMSATVTVRTN